MKEEDIKKIACSLGGGYDYPFKDDFKTFVLRHKGSKKWFGVYISAPFSGLVGEEPFKGEALAGCCKGGRASVLCLKCPAELSHILRGQYAGVLPAYHMNKRCWISVVPGADVPDGQIEELIKLSYDITSPRARRRGGKDGTKV